MLCPNCKKEIADGAQFCPECGGSVNTPAKKQKKPITKKWWFWVIIAVVVIAIVSAAGGGNSDDTSADADNNAAVEQNDAETTTAGGTETTTEADDGKYYVGETLNDGDVAITFASAEDWNDYEQYFAPESGNKIVKVKFDVVNNSSNDYFIGSFDCYADNQAATDYYYGDGGFSTLTVSAGRSASGYVYFEVPANAESIEIEYETNYWTDEKAVFVVEV